MKRIIASAFVAVVLFSLFLFVPSVDSSVCTGFIVFSDTHVGRGVGADGLSGAQRLQALVAYAGKYRGTLLINLGDLTDSWSLNNAVNEAYYNQYVGLTSGLFIRNVKGNHDVNLTKYVSKFGAVNWAFKLSGVYYVGIGSVNEDCPEWMEKGTCYDATTYAFLKNAVKSADYNSSRYRFLFMHYAPDSVWPTDGSHGVSAKLAGYYRFFTAVIHGHEGGKESVTLWNGETLAVHCSHLGDGVDAKDTFLFVHLNVTANRMSIVTHNFVLGKGMGTLYRAENVGGD